MTIRPSIITLGGNRESRIALQRMLDAGCNISGSIILPSSSYPRVSDFEDLSPLCSKAGIPFIATDDINGKNTLEWLKHKDPMHLFVLGWSQIVKKEVRDQFSGLCVGSHPTPLPLRRGRAPISWTIVEGYTTSAVSLFELVDRVDSGRILVQREFPVPKRAYAKDLYDLAANEMGAAYCDLYNDILSGTIRFIQRDDMMPTMRGKRTVADGFIDFSRPVADIDRLVRAASKPYPGAYFYYRDRRIVSWRVEPHIGMEYIGIYGQILAIKKTGILIAAGDGAIWLDEFESDEKSLEKTFFRIGDVVNFRINDKLFELEARIKSLESKLNEL